MAFYVPLGPRGVLFRLGTFVIGVWGGLVYQLAYRRRPIMLSNPGPFPSAQRHGALAYHPLELARSIPDTLVQAAILGESEAAALA